jgi:IMP and pyridine-specific 5'-nucleotidase
VISLVKDSGVELVTFDGDVTLYDDGTSFRADNPALPCLLRLLKRGVKVGIVTAAGYTDASKYYGRLQGLLDAVSDASELGDLR